MGEIKMAIYFGKEQLVRSLQLAKRQEDIKGIEGEIRVGDLLDQYLPDDTYLIAHPEIGNYEPDFLVISPRYGFRLIEVKNISLTGISNIQSNGNFVTRYGSRNYFNQVRAHVDDLKSYLLSNHPYLGDTHKTIGYCVLNVGFTKGDLERKFEIQIESWDESHTHDFFKYHLFIDQLNAHIDAVLGQTTKFPSNRYTSLTAPRLKDIASNLKISEEIHSIHEEIEEPTQAKLETVTTPNPRNLGKWVISGIVILLLAVATAYFSTRSNDDISLSNVADHEGETIKVEAEVTSFYFDADSKTKLLRIKDESGSIEAVIFDEVEVPFIKEGGIYTFSGKVQNYKGKLELKVESVE